MDHTDIEEQVSMNVNDREVLVADSDSSDDEYSGSGSEQFGFFSRSGMIRLEEGNSEHNLVKKGFLLGMGPFEKDTNVVAIHKNSHSSFTRQARVQTFHIFSAAVARKCGGNANIKYAWCGASKHKICEIISDGFSRCGGPVNSKLFGFGIYLSPTSFSVDGALSSIIDENGLRHLLLCRVILGKMEVVCAGSKQFHPSSEEFDSGVDNLSSPGRYIIWSTYMNSHILPNYIISFKAPCFEGSERMPASVVRPTSPWVRFSTLMSILSRVLLPPKMDLISKYHNDFLDNKISRPHLIQTLRQIAGDKLLLAVLLKFYKTNSQLEARTRSLVAAADPNDATRDAADA